MLSKESIFALVVALLALMGYASGLEDNIGQVLLIDGPGGYLPDGYLPDGYLPDGYLPDGYLPDGDSLDSYANSAQIQFDNYDTLRDSSINFKNFLNTMGYWEAFFGNWNVWEIE